MPKSAKKRKEKAADFSKAKLKLGKGKAIAANAVDTSFKARSIALPSQSITAERDGTAPKTRRNLGLSELIVQLKHYSPQVKRDALSGLRELLQDNPEIIQGSITALLRSCAQLVTDEDSSVRKGLLTFFDWYFDTIPADVLRPHLPTLLLFLTSAQTHIFPEIRIDDMVTRGWADTHDASSAGSSGDGKRVLAGYLALLNASGSREEAEAKSSTSGAVLSPASRLLVLRSLANFLQQAIDHSQATATTTAAWFFASSFDSRSAFETFAALLPSSTDLRRQTMITAKATVDEFPDVGIVVGTASDHQAWSLAYILASDEPSSSSFNTIHSGSICSRIEAWRPTTAAQQDLDTVVAVVNILRVLFVNIFRDGTVTSAAVQRTVGNLQGVLAFMEPYFPFHFSSADSHAEKAAERLNIMFCEMTGLLALASFETATRPAAPRHRKGKQPASRKRFLDIAAQVERVSDFIINCLDLNAIAQQLSAEAFNSFLPTIWSLLNWTSSSATSEDHSAFQDKLLAATVTYATNCSSTGAVKPVATAFVARLLLISQEPQYNGVFNLRLQAPAPEIVRWLQELPKLCWQLGDTNFPLTETILTFLLRIAQRDDVSLVAAHIRSRLCPYFTISHQSRGKLSGPFAKLARSNARCVAGTGSLARLALDVAHSYCREPEAEELRSAVAWAVQTTPISVA
ncbi:hypothetical protein BKA62DRAFT_685701 [Auriculariales sp. MPI-PUGE-AT-0066]|nr:hypothetical protein BKA62DRAFT_685701 [Auriculariales sp. MPI-PUGE-AT-0066]